MSKVVYLFGAGASFGTLPLVNEMPKRITDLIQIISKEPFLLSDSEKFEGITAAPSQSKRKYQNEMNREFRRLKEICENHFSVDTFAKKLTIRRDVEELKKLKILLSVFFVIEQIIYRPNPRYDFFFASLIESIHALPKNIRILSWNYDTQFEIAFSEFSKKNEISDNQDLLKIFNKASGITRSDVDGFGIFKLNGSTELRYRHNRESATHYFNLDSNPPLDRIHLEKIIKLYVMATNERELYPSFLFAWEQDPHTDFNNIVIEETKDAEILVVIGYSFPYFNRTMDRGIISKMKNLSKVYFQSPEAKELIERFKSIRDDLSPAQLIPISDLKYFYIPHELS
jgi:hypothetical protein